MPKKTKIKLLPIPPSARLRAIREHMEQIPINPFDSTNYPGMLGWCVGLMKLADEDLALAVDHA